MEKITHYFKPQKDNGIVRENSKVERSTGTKTRQSLNDHIPPVIVLDSPEQLSQAELDRLYNLSTESDSDNQPISRRVKRKRLAKTRNLERRQSADAAVKQPNKKVSDSGAKKPKARRKRVVSNNKANRTLKSANPVIELSGQSKSSVVTISETNSDSENVRSRRKRARKSIDDSSPKRSISHSANAVNCQLWIDKYRPKTYDDYLDHSSQVDAFKKWLSSWDETFGSNRGMVFWWNGPN